MHLNSCVLMVLLSLVGATRNAIIAKELSRDQKLIVACYQVDLETVVKLIKDDANVNSTLGKVDGELARDHWSRIRHNTVLWTPLLALANSSPNPDPPAGEVFDNGDREQVRKALAKIPAIEFERRRQRMLTIMYVLVSHSADINARDSNGRTSLYLAVDRKKLDLAKALLEFDPDVNTTTTATIDGPLHLTPLHRAYWSRELFQLLQEKGADPSAKDSWGNLPELSGDAQH